MQCTHCISGYKTRVVKNNYYFRFVFIKCNPISFNVDITLWSNEIAMLTGIIICSALTAVDTKQCAKAIIKIVCILKHIPSGYWTCYKNASLWGYVAHCV